MKINKIVIEDIAQYCIEKVFRINTNEPGFVHLDFGKDINSNQLRSIMVDLKKELSKYTTGQFNKGLTYQWLVRFDQQVDTPYHIDNAGNQSFLMLGYEPSEIESELYLADYYKYANDGEVAQKDFLENFSPVFIEDESLIASYITNVKPFDKDSYKIVLVNNSNPQADRETLGVFHKAKIVKGDLNRSRVVNSMLINMLPDGENNDSNFNEKEFIMTDVISE
ncbi:hypothetical protein [Gillisia sp. CAL575]|uniref:hypothetical protein n=1 Tax=Gillisia sp. CAL575 TaxID=985255 RepID=UPI0003A01459|nr:hypothetical protein [Gillisia sp. CAL575]